MEIFIRKWSEVSGGRFDPLYLLCGSQVFLKNTSFSIKTLGSVIQSIKTGFAAGKNDQSDFTKGIIQIRPTNLDENGILKFEKNIYIPRDVSSEHLITKGEVLFNNTNSQELVGKTAYFDLEGDFVSSNHITRIKTDTNQLLPKYLSILLNIYQKNKIFFNTCVNWNNQSGINIDFLKSYQIPLPPIPTQEKIIAIMDNAYKQKEIKEQQAKEILDSIDSYLMQELGINFPNNDYASLEQRIFTQKISHLSGIRFDPNYHQKYYQDLERVIENGKYSLKTLGEITTLVASGSTPKSKGKDYEKNGKYYFLRLVNFNPNFGIDLQNALFVKEYIYNGELARVKLRNGDILFGIAGSLGKVAQYNYNFLAVVNQAIAVLRFKENILNEFILYILSSCIVQCQITRLKRPVAQPNINTQELKSIVIPLPPLAIQEQIVNEINNRRERAKKLQQEAKEILESAKKQVESIILGG